MCYNQQMSKKKQPDDAQILEIPARITHRLESDGSVIAEVEAVLPVEVNDEIINGMHEEALMTGKSYERIVNDLLTQTVAHALAHDEKKQAHFRHIAKEHRSNILTEVTVTGKITLPRTTAAKH